MLLGVALHELFEDIAANERQCLLFKIRGFFDIFLSYLLGDFRLRLGGSEDAPKLTERVHVEGHVIRFAIDKGNGGVHVVVELAELAHIIPNATQGSVKDVGSVSVHVYAFDFFGEDVSRYMVAAINHQALFADLLCFMREDGARQACAYD